MLTAGFTFFPQFVKAEININSEYNITTDQTFIFETFNLREDIVIADNVNVEFLGCRFNFLNESEANGIIGGNNVNVTFQRCEFYGLDTTSGGNSYLKFSSSPENIIIIDSEFVEVGSLSNTNVAIKISGSSLNHENVVIRDCSFTGSKTFLQATYLNRTFIDSSSINIDGDEREGLIFESSNHTQIKNCNITTKGSAIRILNGLSNATILNSSFSSQSSYCISAHMKNDINGAYPLRIINNTFTSSASGVELLSCPNAVVCNNTFDIPWKSLSIDNSDMFMDSNKTISNNTFSSLNSEKSGGLFIEWNGGAINCTFSGNSFLFNESIDGEYTIVDVANCKEMQNITTYDSNRVNGNAYYLFAGRSNSSISRDFSETENIGGIIIHSVNDSRFENIRMINQTNIEIYNCDNITLNTLEINDDIQCHEIHNSKNITVENSTFRKYSGGENYIFRVNASIDVTFNGSLFEYTDEAVARHGLLLDRDNRNITIQNCTFSGIINFALDFQATNGSLIENNTFAIALYAMKMKGSYYNNFTGNEFSKKPEYIEDEEDLEILAPVDLAAYYNNTYDYNHWIGNINGYDDNDDNICDEGYVMQFTFPTGEITDNYPLFFDNDNDNLDNLQEDYFGSDRNLQDTDDDGLDDYYEVRTSNTAPDSDDSDGDGINDGEEVYNGDDGYITDPLNEDSDGDLFSDLEEINAGSDPNDPNSFPGGYYNEDNSQNQDGEEDLNHQAYWIPGREYYLPITIGMIAVIVIFGEMRGYFKNRKNKALRLEEEL